MVGNKRIIRRSGSIKPGKQMKCNKCRFRFTERLPGVLLGGTSGAADSNKQAKCPKCESTDVGLLFIT